MASARKLRLDYRVDAEPVNGWWIARCEALDLVSQGRSADQALTLLQEEAGLVLSHAKATETLPGLLDRLNAAPAAKGASGFEINLTQIA